MDVSATDVQGVIDHMLGRIPHEGSDKIPPAGYAVDGTTQIEVFIGDAPNQDPELALRVLQYLFPHGSPHKTDNGRALITKAYPAETRALGRLRRAATPGHEASKFAKELKNANVDAIVTALNSKLGRSDIPGSMNQRDADKLEELIGEAPENLSETAKTISKNYRALSVQVELLAAGLKRMKRGYLPTVEDHMGFHMSRKGRDETQAATRATPENIANIQRAMKNRYTILDDLGKVVSLEHREQFLDDNEKIRGVEASTIIGINLNLALKASKGANQGRGHD